MAAVDLALVAAGLVVLVAGTAAAATLQSWRLPLSAPVVLLPLTTVAFHFSQVYRVPVHFLAGAAPVAVAPAIHHSYGSVHSAIQPVALEVGVSLKVAAVVAQLLFAIVHPPHHSLLVVLFQCASVAHELALRLLDVPNLLTGSCTHPAGMY